MVWGGLINFHSGKLALKPCSNFSRTSLREGLAGRKVEVLTSEKLLRLLGLKHVKILNVMVYNSMF